MDYAFELEEYVERRSRLAGAALIEQHNPYNLEIDTLRTKWEQQGKSLANFAQYDYLGLANDTRVIDAACDAVRNFGPGVGASRVVGGERSLHRRFEKTIADFVGHHDSLNTVSGYGLNVSLIGHLLGSADLLIIDELSHNSIQTGAELTRASKLCFRHNDMDHLEYILGSNRKKHKRVLIVAEGLYSMDGDMPDLPRLLDIKRRYGAWLMLDEAHSIGVLGKTGRGLSEHFGTDPREIEFIIGTLSKALASCGGFVCASSTVIHWLRHTLPSFVYSVGAAPSVVAASLAVIEILKTEPGRVSKLHANSHYFASGARSRGLEVGNSAGFGIVPIQFSSKENAMKASLMLLERGYYIPPILQQAVSHDKPRLRIFVSAAHEVHLIDKVLDEIAIISAELGEILHNTSNVVPLIPQKLAAAMASYA
jgi:8-amino-7-oxononanoate synthase